MTAIYQSIYLASHLVTVKRLDLLSPHGVGNKIYKLKYNLEAARQQGYRQILSFGGAYSNHIAALAALAPKYQLASIGCIRGEELAHRPLNSVLKQANQRGMQLRFLSRQTYRRRNQADFLSELEQIYPQTYILPEGGSNQLAVAGCCEILQAFDEQYDLIACAVGTGATLAGLIHSAQPHQQLHGFAALKGDFITASVGQWVNPLVTTHWQVHSDHYFGGYGRYDHRLTTFIAQMLEQYQLPLEPIYTGKALYALAQYLPHYLTQQHKKPRILFIHTGGLQDQPFYSALL